MAKSKKSKKISNETSDVRTIEFFSLFTDYDIELFKSGKHYRLYEKLGSHIVEHQGASGVYFAVWAPNARYVSVIGNFNSWNKGAHPLQPRWDGSGIWESFIPRIGQGEVYKYFINTKDNEDLEKGDPYAFFWEVPPMTASIVWDLKYKWSDNKWMKKRAAINALNAPISVYEVHLGSWQRSPHHPEKYLDYKHLAKSLTEYVKDMGYTHVEFMPVMEHPYAPSWGYQITGYFAPSSRFGSPQDFMYLVDELHQAGIGVILDWVPSHYPGDAHGLFRFDGTNLYEHEDMRKGFHPDWKSYIFNYGRYEVRSFLISNALFWLDRYHADGLRVDAVASMLYLDYSRNEGEWTPNHFGGRENLEAISLLKEINEAVYSYYPDVQTIAEESTAFTGVSRPTYSGGLGFGMKWMMGWMHDTLSYFAKDPMYRKYHNNQITFSMVYAFTENFMLPFSHDEVVYGKGSMINKMPGDIWQRFANLRVLYSYMFTHPGAKLLFMGCDFAQIQEWNFERSLDWHLTEDAKHKGIQKTIRDLNKLYRKEAALYEKQFDPQGFEWLDANDWERGTLSYLRKGNEHTEPLLTVLNLTPVPREDYKLGVPDAGIWQILFNSDDEKYGGSDYLKAKSIESEPAESHGNTNSITFNLPPLAALVLKRKNN
ncbi:MAG: 1,4-alpha-glucan branching protein GlgB [Bacteroidota bacterium]|jgi:1,4-alpha-glucan branching enzyme